MHLKLATLHTDEPFGSSLGDVSTLGGVFLPPFKSVGPRFLFLEEGVASKSHLFHTAGIPSRDVDKVPLAAGSPVIDTDGLSLQDDNPSGKNPFRHVQFHA